MDTKGTDVGTSFAGDPEDTHVTLLVVIEELALIDGSDSKLLLNGGDQRRALEDRAGQAKQGLFNLLDFLHMLMKLNDSNVLFTSRLLSLNETSGVVDAGNEAPSDLRI